MTPAERLARIEQEAVFVRNDVMEDFALDRPDMDWLLRVARAAVAFREAIVAEAHFGPSADKMIPPLCRSIDGTEAGVAPRMMSRDAGEPTENGPQGQSPPIIRAVEGE